MNRSLPFAALVLVGCSGTIGTTDYEDPNSPHDDFEIPSAGEALDRILEAPESCEAGLSPTGLRRLSGRQYRNSLVAIFGGDLAVPDADVLDDPVVHGFRVDADASVVRDLGAQRVMQHAERVAAWAVGAKLDLFTTCRDTTLACRAELIERFGERAFREPITDAQREAYDALFQMEETFEAGAEVVMAAMLQSPRFLYRREIGVADGGRQRLSAYEVASELAYLTTEGPPDAELYAAAAEGRLETPADVERELARLLETPAAERMLGHFVEGWLEVEDLEARVKDDTVFMLTPEMRASMLNETRALYLDLVRSGGTFEDMMTAEHTFVDGQLAALYGLPGEGRVDLAGTNRTPGILGHGSVLTRHALAANSSPVARGLLIRERFLCQHLPDPPAGVDTDIEGVADAPTTRERYREHSTNQACAGCHQLMDPIGFSFEHYDAFGRYREDENGNAIDASGSISGLPGGGDVGLDGLQSLAEALADEPAARDCYARHLAYFAYGRAGCGETVTAVAETPDGSLRAMLRELVTAPQFYERVVGE
ncbi:MAG: DUF1592 domain-containing protein [Deltaproteobacteria bacterium]|nr:DUF1592 domain-containing protein [Deltaproteobacteria bacterium]